MSRVASNYPDRVLSKPRLASVILLATTAIVSGALAIWLLLWVVTSRPGSMATIVVEPSGLGIPVVGFQQADVAGLGRGRPLVATGSASDRAFRSALGDLAGATGRAPVVLYVSAPGVEYDGRAYLLPSDPAGFLTSKAGEDALISVESLLEALRAIPDRQKFVVLDVCQFATERDLGVFGNGFIHRLETALSARPVPGLVVLASAAPGQSSWTSESDGCSVFGHYVTEGMTGAAAGWDSSGRVTVQGLARYVTAHVARWAQANRQARQTPILLGETGLNFPLRTLSRVAAKAGPSPDDAAAEAEAEAPKSDSSEGPGPVTVAAALKAGWETQDRLASKAPEVGAPTLWRRYRDGLLRAERLVRVGEEGLARDVLSSLSELATRVEAQSLGEPLSRPWSLALAQSHTASLTAAQKSAVSVASNDLERFIDQNTGRRAAAEIIETTEASGSGPGVKEGSAPSSEAGGEPAKASDAAATKKAREEGPVPLARLEDRAGSRVPKLVEGQLAVWAGLYRNLPGAVEFQGRRAEALHEAVQLRRLAEMTATTTDRLARRIEGPLGPAEALRRRAQDRLFSMKVEDVESSSRDLIEARERYRAVLEYAELVGRGARALARLQADLPYLGAWKARRERGLDPGLATLLDEVVLLAGQLEEVPPTDPTALRDRTRDLSARVSRVESADDRLHKEFLAACNLARSGNSPPKWRVLDDLLMVPLVPADLRASLLERLMGLESLPPLEGPDSSVVPPTTTASEEVEPDPTFWGEALAVGRLECALLALGSAGPAQVGPLLKDLEAARGSTTHAEVAFEAMGRFSKGVRSVRATLAAQFGRGAAAPERAEDEGELERSLAQADAAARVLPAAFLATMADENLPDRAYARYLRHEQLHMLGRRLLEDNAPEHAQLVLNEAAALFDTRATSEDVAKAQEVARSRLVVSAQPRDSITIGGGDEKLGVSVSASGEVPAGLATIVMSFDPVHPLDVAELDASGGALVPGQVAVPPERGLTREFRLRRLFFSPEQTQFDLRPTVFYRGRTHDTGAPLVVLFNPAEEQVDVRLVNDVQGFRDQFELHPGRGYLHYKTTLAYQIALTNRTKAPLNAWVRYGLDGQVAKTTTVRLEPGKVNKTLGDQILAVDLSPLIPPPPPEGVKPTVPPPPPPKAGPNEVALGTPRILTVEVRENGPTGRSLAIIRRFEFHQMDIPEYAYAFAHFNPALGRLRVIARHLPGDRVTGPLKFRATIAGNVVDAPAPPPGEFAWFDWYFPVPFPKKIAWAVEAGFKERAFSGEEPTNVELPVVPGQPAATADQPRL